MPATHLTLRDDRPRLAAAIAAIAGSVALATLIAVVLRDAAPAISLGVLYVLAVLVVATAYGLWPGLATAVLGGAAFNFFLIEPTGRFTVASGEDWVALGLFVAVAAIASSLAERIRARARVAELRRQEALISADLARILLGEERLTVRLGTAAQRIADAAGADSAEIVPGDRPAPPGEAAIELDGPRGPVGTLLVPAALPEQAQRRLRQRVAPALGTLLAAALERDRLAAEVVETQALRRSDALKTALLRAVSHDLRSPLTAITTAGEALRSPTLPDEDREELADVVVEEAARLDDLIAKLLDLSRLQAGTAAPHADWVEIGELLHGAAEEVERRDPHGGSITWALHGELPLVRADPAQLERVFVNLIENARRFSAGKPVSIRARAAGERLVVRVVDQGPGIAPAVQRRVFDPFWRGDDSTRHPGSGLGLAIAKGFVEANGGRIALESVPGQGTTIVVELPVPRHVPRAVEIAG